MKQAVDFDPGEVFIGNNFFQALSDIETIFSNYVLGWVLVFDHQKSREQATLKVAFIGFFG